MKRAIFFFLLPAIAFLNSACERHDASELAKIEESEAGHEEHGGQNTTHEQSEREGNPNAASPSPAPQFFSR